MKNNVLVLLALAVCTVTFSQKRELRDLEKAIRRENFTEAKQALKVVEPLVGAMDEEQRAEFGFLKAQALYANGAGTEAEIDQAVSIFAEVNQDELDEDDVMEVRQKMVSSILEKGQKAYQNKKFKLSSSSFENVYRLSTVDTIYLYYAATMAVNEPDYDRALELYKELRELKYTGIATEYTAINKETNEVEVFGNKNIRDLQVKAGTHIKPEMRVTESKSSEIIKNMALIYDSMGNVEKAIEATQQARVENPDDLSLLMTEANLHFKAGNKQKFQELLQEATRKDPNNAELQFNLGVLAAEAGDREAAKKYYQKTLEIDPTYNAAELNMAVLILDGEQKLIDEMNSLGTSAEDNKRYDALIEKRKALYREAIPHLENVLKNDADNADAIQTLAGIYGVLGNTEKADELRARLQN